MAWTTDTIFVGNYHLAKGFERDTDATGPWSTYRNTADGTVYRPNMTDNLPNGQEFEVINKDGVRIGTAPFSDVNNIDHRDKPDEDHKITVTPNGEKPPVQPKDTNNSKNASPTSNNKAKNSQSNPSTSANSSNTNHSQSQTTNNESDKIKKESTLSNKSELKPASQGNSLLESNTPEGWKKALDYIKSQTTKK